MNYTYKVGIEFTANSFTFVSDDCLNIRVDRKAGAFNGDVLTSLAELMLDNFTGKYSPRNSNSPFYPYVTPGKRVLVTATSDTSSVYNIYNGIISTIAINPELSDNTIKLTCEDEISNLFDVSYSLEPVTNYPVSSLFNDICNYVGVQSHQSDNINDSITIASAFQDSAKNTLKNVIEEGFHWLVPRSNGELHLKSRSELIYNSTVVSSYDEYFSFNYNFDKRDIINSLIFDVEKISIETDRLAINYANKSIILASGNNRFILRHIDPYTGESDAIFSNVYFNSAYLTSDISGVNDVTDQCSLYSVSFGNTSVVSAFNGTADIVYVQSLELYGDYKRIIHENYFFSASSSQSVYGVKAKTKRHKFLTDDSYISDYADLLLTYYQENVDDVNYSLKNVYPDILQNDITDLVFLTQTNVGINDKFIITSITHNINLSSGLEHTVFYSVDKWLDNVGFRLDVDHLNINYIGI